MKSTGVDARGGQQPRSRNAARSDAASGARAGLMPGEGGGGGGLGSGIRSSFLFKTNESGTKAAVVNPKTAKSLFENKRNKNQGCEKT